MTGKRITTESEFAINFKNRINADPYSFSNEVISFPRWLFKKELNSPLILINDLRYEKSNNYIRLRQEMIIDQRGSPSFDHFRK